MTNSLARKMYAEDMLDATGMISRPEYYSGRGEMVCDLNYNQLTKIAELILQNHGPEAKANFVKMVAEMKKLSATAFIQNLYLLQRNGWVWQSEPHRDGIAIDSEATAFASFAEVMFGRSDRDETPAIRNRFLQENGIRVNYFSGREKYGYGYEDPGTLAGC